MVCAPVIHYTLGYLFAITLQMGVCGLSLSIIITNSIIYSVQYYQMSRLEELKECNKVRWYDRRNIQNLKEYLKLAFPSMFLLVFEWSA